MTELKLRNLKVSKVQKTETETENGITNKWTYEFQDDDKEFKLTLKTEHERNFVLDETVDVRFGNDQMKLDISTEDPEEEPCEEHRQEKVPEEVPEDLKKKADQEEKKRK